MKINIIGLGLSIDDLTQKHINIINKADILIGGKRHLEYFKNIKAQTITITKDIKKIIETIKEKSSTSKIVVLASGDPLFYGIGSTLVQALGKDNINIFPNISSVVAAFSKIKETWHDAKLISLHGRQISDLEEIFLKETKIAILTDLKQTPSWIAKNLKSYIESNKFFYKEHIKSDQTTNYENSKIHNRGNFHIKMYVFEQLGSLNEKISSYNDISLVLDKDFKMPNLVILKKTDNKLISKKNFDISKFNKTKTIEISEVLKSEKKEITKKQDVSESNKIKITEKPDISESNKIEITKKAPIELKFIGRKSYCYTKISGLMISCSAKDFFKNLIKTDKNDFKSTS